MLKVNMEAYALSMLIILTPYRLADTALWLRTELRPKALGISIAENKVQETFQPISSMLDGRFIPSRALLNPYTIVYETLAPYYGLFLQYLSVLRS